MPGASRNLVVVNLWIVSCVSLVWSEGGRYADSYICPRDGTWSYINVLDRDTQEQKVYCFNVNNAMSYTEAQDRCHSFHAEIHSPGVHFDSLPSGSTLTDFLYKNGINNTWHGFYIQDDRLRQDRFPLPPTQYDMVYAQAVQYWIPWRTNEPLGTSQCFKATLGCPSGPIGEIPGGNFSDLPIQSPSRFSKRSSDVAISKMLNSKHKMADSRVKRVVPELPTGGGLCGDTLDNVASHPCSEPLPFVCIKPALDKYSVSLSEVTEICQPDEFGNYQLSRCISYGKEMVNATIALSRCQEKGANTTATLYCAHSVQASMHINQLVVDAVDSAETRFSQLGVSIGSMAWVARNAESGECKALILNRENPDTVSWDCSARLPYYICQRHVDYRESRNFLAYGYSPNGSYPVVEEDVPSTTDVQVSIPYQVAIDKSNSSFILTCVFQNGAVPKIQNMTIVKGGFIVNGLPESGQQFLQKDQSLFLLAGEEITVEMRVPGNEFFIWGDDTLARVTDYYWCEANDLRTGQIRRSSRVFVRVQGMEIYTASIVLTTTGFQRREFILYSLSEYDRSGEFSYLQQRMANSSLYSHRWLRFTPDMSEPNSTWTVGDFYVFKRLVPRLEAFIPTNWTIARTDTILRNHFERNINSSFFLVQTLSVRSIDICPYTTVYDPISNRTYEILDTPLGKVYTSQRICLSNGLPYVILRCVGDKLYGAKWSKFEPNHGCDFDGAARSPITDTLKNIALSDISSQTLQDSVNKTLAIIDRTKLLEPVDVVYIADILQKATELPEISAETGRTILEIVDRMNKVTNTELDESRNLGNAINRIIRSVDHLPDKLVLGDDPKLRLVTNSTAVEVWDVSKVTGDVIIGLELNLGGGEPLSVLNTDNLISQFDSGNFTYKATDTAIILPVQFVRKVKDENADKDVKLSLSVYAETGLFRGGSLYNESWKEDRNVTLNSKVISAKVTVDGMPVSDLDSYVVTIVHLPIVEIPDKSRAQYTACVFWDLNADGGRGGWSGEGCRYQKTVQGRDVCVCDHLTNFAVLVDLYGQSLLPQKHQFALSIITIIGLSLSISGLSITGISFILIPKMRQGRHQQTLFNMALAMLASWIVFLAGFTRVESHGGCIAVAALLHYFILASFLWMLMEGILQYLLFVTVFGTEFDRYMLKTGIPAWGIPLVPVIVVLAIDKDLYRGGNQYCWMSLVPFYYAFLVPVGVIMLANIIIYIMVVVAICRRRDMTKHTNVSEASRRVIGIRASIACFIVLGLSWVFAFFAVEDARVVFQYLFTIINSLQGFLIFLIFTARDPHFRAFWRAKCCGKKKTTNRKTDDVHVQGQRSRSRSDEFPLSCSNQSSSTGESRNHSSRRTSPTLPRSPVNVGIREVYLNGNGYDDGYGNSGYDNGYGNPGYQVYKGE